MEAALELSVAYAKERFTFGRAIGSYQAIKHALVEVLRPRREHALAALLRRLGAPGRAGRVRAGGQRRPRAPPGGALDYASRELISVHGGIGATWEHDAPLYFRRAQLSRRLLGGEGSATDRVAEELLESARAAA